METNIDGGNVQPEIPKKEKKKKLTLSNRTLSSL